MFRAMFRSLVGRNRFLRSTTVERPFWFTPEGVPRPEPVTRQRSGTIHGTEIEYVAFPSNSWPDFAEIVYADGVPMVPQFEAALAVRVRDPLPTLCTIPRKTPAGDEQNRAPPTCEEDHAVRFVLVTVALVVDATIVPIFVGTTKGLTEHGCFP
jgi:hypothetical protein